LAHRNIARILIIHLKTGDSRVHSLLLAFRAKKHSLLISLAAAAISLSGCGGGGGGGSPPNTDTSPPPAPVTYTAASGVAQKGPLILGSNVTAQELDASLSPSGKQYSYQTTSDLGTFNPNSTFTSQYVGVNASGYYFDEVANGVSAGTITLNAYSDLSAVSVLNVNLLTTLAYQRIQNLVTKQSMAFTAAQAQAQNEVLAAFNIRNPGSLGSFGTFDLGKGGDGDHILAALSSLFVYGNTSGNLSALIAEVQSDIGTNGAITNAATQAALLSSAQSLDPNSVAAHLGDKYASIGVTFLGKDISGWLDADGDGLIGRLKFYAVRAPQASMLPLPAYVTDPYAGKSLSVSAGQLFLNGAAVTGPVTPNAGDVIAMGPPAGFSSGALTAYLSNGTTKVGRVSFYGHGAWSRAAAMNMPRWSGMAAVLLPTGKVLALGGCASSRDDQCVGADSEIYDPSTDAWSGAAPDPAVREGGTATLLTAGPNAGKVLVVGGWVFAGASVDNSASLSAELYDPVANSWSPAGNLSTARANHSATLLSNGNVLVVGGADLQTQTPMSSCEIYDATSNSWATVSSLAAPRSNHRAVLLTNGKVLVVTGLAAGPSSGATYSTTAESYDPALDSWSGAGMVITPRSQATASLLGNGQVLVAGGISGSGVSGTELYDPVANSWSAGPGLLVPLAAAAAVTLTGGDVLLLGSSYQNGIEGTYTWNPQLYDPVANSWSSAVGSYAPQQAANSSPDVAFQLADGVVLSLGHQGLGDVNLLYWR
jgi:hypothetical protein